MEPLCLTCCLTLWLLSKRRGDLTTGFGFGRGRSTGALKNWDALDELEGEGCAEVDAAVEAQALEPLSELLRSENEQIQAQAAWALANLIVHPETKLDVLRLGVLDTLRGLHISHSDEVVAASSKVLGSLGEVLTPNSRRVVEGKPKFTTSRSVMRRSSPLASGGQSAAGVEEEHDDD